LWAGKTNRADSPRISFRQSPWPYNGGTIWEIVVKSNREKLMLGTTECVNQRLWEKFEGKNSIDEINACLKWLNIKGSLINLGVS